MKIILLLALFLSATPAKERVLFRSLDPESVQQHLAFYKLYGDTEEGKRALNEACALLSGNKGAIPAELPQLPIDEMIHLFISPSGEDKPILSEQTLAWIEKLALRLNKKENTSRQLLELEFEADQQKIRSYEAMIDLMALQILAHTKMEAPPREKIAAINQFLFHEMAFKFPPHSLWAKNIDEYTFLPAVLDSRRGVCLGISILYLALAERLNLPLEVVTPPGHIYVRYRDDLGTTVIETTARGVDMDEEIYQSLAVDQLQVRTIKEVPGLAYVNKASVNWAREKPEEVKRCYDIAAGYLPNDSLLTSLRAANLILLDQKKQAIALLETIDEDEPIIEDILQDRIGKEGIAAIFLHVDSDRASILTKKDALAKAFKMYPSSRALLFHLATTNLQLSEQKQALKELKQYHTLDNQNPTVEYILAALLTERLNYPAAWTHLLQAETLVKEYETFPKPLLALREELSRRSPR